LGSIIGSVGGHHLQQALREMRTRRGGFAEASVIQAGAKTDLHPIMERRQSAPTG
jgi:hypothetical protein